MSPSLRHDLRTPLNHIIGYSEMILEEAHDRMSQGFRSDLERIQIAGRRLLGVINDFFDPTMRPGSMPDAGRLDREVRAPLNEIIGYTEMLQELATESDMASFLPDLQKIRTAAHQLLERVMAEVKSGKEQSPAPVSNPPDEARSPANRVIASRSPGRVSGRLLVADDDPANREILARRLAWLGHEVTLVENGSAAVNALREQPFDLLLLDIQMPEMDGYQVLQALAADIALHHVPVIVLSASDEVIHIASAIEMGAEDYIPKPFDSVLLNSRISACLEKKRLRDREATYLHQIEDEKKRSDDLLRVILPDDIAQELKATDRVKPRRYEQVGVLFSDIVGFTAYSDEHPPEEIVQHLQTLVEHFEEIATRHGLEKIKTIGDSFMAVAGLVSPLANPALNCIQCGLEMIEATSALLPFWRIRVGVHVGPVVAGVVGRRKYQYDVWGDAVNTASRMEAAAAPGSICVNRQTWTMLQEHCSAHPHGSVDVKGKGKQEIFTVVSIRSLSDR